MPPTACGLGRLVSLVTVSYTVSDTTLAMACVTCASRAGSDRPGHGINRLTNPPVQPEAVTASVRRESPLRQLMGATKHPLPHPRSRGLAAACPGSASVALSP